MGNKSIKLYIFKILKNEEVCYNAIWGEIYVER